MVLVKELMLIRSLVDSTWWTWNKGAYLHFTYALSICSGYQSSLGETRWLVEKSILKYLRRTKDDPLVKEVMTSWSSKAILMWVSKHRWFWITVWILLHYEWRSGQLVKPKTRNSSKFYDVMMCKVHIDDNIADSFTKPMSRPKHDSHTRAKWDQAR